MRTTSYDICIIDDEVVVCKRLQQTLERDGHRVEIFVDSRAALARIRSRRFDVVITDVRMPEVDGMAVLDAVTGRHEGTAVIMITGFSTDGLTEAAAQRGAAAFLRKPFSVADIRAAVREATAATAGAAGST